MLSRSTRHATAQLSRLRGCLRQASSSIVDTIPASVDDRTLVSVFDRPPTPTFASGSSIGLFGHTSLTQPHKLVELANSTLFRAQLLTERILRARQSQDELKTVVKNLDRLSDLLCGVIDLSELIQNAHPDDAWVGAANAAYEMLCEYINILNTHEGLDQVRTAVQLCPFTGLRLSGP